MPTSTNVLNGRAKDLQKDGPGPQTGAGTAYQSLIYSIFQQSRAGDRGFTIGLVSPEPGAGTSFLTHEFIAQLGADAGNRVLGVDLAFVARTVQSVEDLLARVAPTTAANVFELRPHSKEAISTRGSAYWNGSMDHRRDCVHALADQFDYILFDCPALQLSGDALGIASVIDGFLLVIEANRTTTQQIQNTEQNLEGAGGKLYGSILNKQKSLLPRWAQGFF